MVLEDLQRADDALLDAVEELLALATEVPLLLIVTAWPELLERRPRWGTSGPDMVTLSLPPLDESETIQLLSGLLGPDLPTAALTRLVALAGGNPMYAEECAGMLRDREAAQLVRGIPELPLPRSVQGLVASRLDLVSDDERAVLHAASRPGRQLLADPRRRCSPSCPAPRSRSASPSWHGEGCCAGCAPRAFPGSPSTSSVPLWYASWSTPACRGREGSSSTYAPPTGGPRARAAATPSSPSSSPITG